MAFNPKSLADVNIHILAGFRLRLWPIAIRKVIFTEVLEWTLTH